MRITPLEIRQKSFEKKLRGYDKDEVNAFLTTLSQVWEQIMEENKELKLNYENAQREIKQLREVENSLFKTLKTAEDTGANIMDQANKAAELHLRETQMSADALLNEAKSKARSIIDEADVKSTQIIDEMEGEVKNIAQVYRNLENHRDNLLTELQNLSNDTLRRVDKIMTNGSSFDIEQYMNEVRKFVSSSQIVQTPQKSKNVEPPARQESAPSRQEPTAKPIAQPELTQIEEDPETPDEQSDEGSFFDKLD